MKKVVLSLAVLFSMAMVSCGGNKEANTVDTDTVAVEEVAVVEDSAAADTTVVAEVAEVAVDSAAAAN